MKANRLIAVTTLALASMAALADPQYAITDLGTVGGNSQGYAISSTGNYVFGRTVSTGTYPGFTQATAAGSTRSDWTMNSPNLYISPAGGGVNTAGVAVAGAGTTTYGSASIPVMYRNGTLTNLTMPSGYTTGLASDINNSGIAVGYVGSGATQKAAMFSTFSNTVNTIDTLSSSGIAMTSAKSINDNGLIVGSGVDANGKTVGLVYNSVTNTMTELGIGILPNNVSSNGLVIGTDSNTGGSFSWSVAGGYVDTGLRGTGSDINSSGWFVGKTGNAGNAGYVSDGTSSFLLDSVVLDPNDQWSFFGSSVSVSGIANNGYIVGTALYGNEIHAVLLTPVPEPTTWALMLAGLIGVGAIARRRQAGN